MKSDAIFPVAALVDGVLVDLNEAPKGAQIITSKDEAALMLLNHSCAHLLAAAIKALYPSATFGVGPAIEEGFYYDFKLDGGVSEADLELIEAKMLELAAHDFEIRGEVVSKATALSLFYHDPYKLELIKDIKDEIKIYRLGNFADLCRGPHLPNSGLIKHFKLLSLAGAYWRGDSNNDMLQRIYGVAFFTKAELDAHLALLEERKRRDHRRLGKDLKLFMFSPLAGQGLPIWLPRGMAIRQELQNYILKMERKFGYQQVATPVLGSLSLYETSGHWAHYHEDMFPLMTLDNEQLVLRPMSCPHHVLIYKSEPRSYRDLPLRLAEQVLQHRYEASGALTGMERVRAMVLTDSHIFVTVDQIKEEFARALKLILNVLSDLNIEVDYYRLSLHDRNNSEKYFDNPQMWEHAERMLEEVLEENHVDYRRAEGEAAFYGPKLDIQIKTVLGHDITMSTLQLDFLLPERFDLSYVDETGGKTRPVMIHRGLIGTYERFLAILLEQYAGVFPTWLAPVQIAILPVGANFKAAAEALASTLIDHDFRAEVDARDEKLGYRLRQAQMEKVPYTLVVGEKEAESGLITYRKFGQKEQVTVTLEDFIALLLSDIANRSRPV